MQHRRAPSGGPPWIKRVQPWLAAGVGRRIQGGVHCPGLGHGHGGTCGSLKIWLLLNHDGPFEGGLKSLGFGVKTIKDIKAGSDELILWVLCICLRSLNPRPESLE